MATRSSMCPVDLSCALLLLVSTAGLSCLPDPVPQQEVARLGGETPGVSPGPLHRPGQPCGLCHGPDGPATTQFVLSGTAYRDSERVDALAGATVHVIDWTGTQYVTTTNCAGNFFIRNTEFTPQWPVWMKVEYGDQTTEMISAVFREPSCNACHADPSGPDRVGHLYLKPREQTPIEAGCP